METTIECTNDPELCQYRRVIVSVAPPDVQRDFRAALGVRRALSRCPICHCDSLQVRRRDMFRRILREA